MAKFSEVENEPGHWLFYCLGCKTHHSVWTTPNKNKVLWNYNNDVDNPTISPSLRVKHFSNEQQKHILCHSFIREGKIEYLNDCTHELAGQIVDIPHWEDT